MGCGNAACTTPLCLTGRSHSNAPPKRQYTKISARMIALALASGDHPQTKLCPYISGADGEPTASGKQVKTDPKSIIQQLSNTEALSKLQPSNTPLALVSQTEKAVDLQYMDCNMLYAIKSTLLASSARYEEKDLRRTETWENLLDRQRGMHEFKQLSYVFTNYRCLVRSFRRDATDDLYFQFDLDGRLVNYLKSWNPGYYSLMFECLWIALEPLFESPFAGSSTFQYRHASPSFESIDASPDSWSNSSKAPHQMVTLPAEAHAEEVSHAALIPILTLTGSVPRGRMDAWSIVWPTLINGKTYGKQRRLTSDPYTSPWLHILDAFQFEPALRLLYRLVTAIGARSCVEETLKNFPAHLKIQRRIIGDLVMIEARSRVKAYGDPIPDSSKHGPRIATTSMIWLEWLRQCVLKNWDGKPEINRWSRTGAALEMMHSMYEDRDEAMLDIPGEIFSTSVILSCFDIHELAQHWLEYQDNPKNPNTRHILHYTFLFSPRALTHIFRTINHVKMRRAYSEVQNAHHMRHALRMVIARAPHRGLDHQLETTEAHYLVIKASRGFLLQDAMDQIWHREKRELFRPLRVRMGFEEGEIGHDLGGVQIEFFKLLCSEVFDTDHSLFITDPQTKMTWFRPASLEPLYKYELVGLLFGLAIYNGVTLPVNFPLAFYRKLLGLPCSPDDLADGWPTLARTLHDLKEYDGSVEDDLARDYMYSFSANGLLIDVSMEDPWSELAGDDGSNKATDAGVGTLKLLDIHHDKHHEERRRSQDSGNYSAGLPENSMPTTVYEPSDSLTGNGKQSGRSDQPDMVYHWPGWKVVLAESQEAATPVTNANRDAYVEDYARWELDYSIRPQYLAFEKGFRYLFSEGALSLFTPTTLRTLIEGHNTIDIAALQQAAQYRGYTAKSPQIRWFWDIVQGYSPDKQKKLLEFVTASSRVPSSGAQSLTFAIEKIEGETEALPGSSTCFGTLRLPEYTTKEVMGRKLDVALEHSIGFGQA